MMKTALKFFVFALVMLFTTNLMAQVPEEVNENPTEEQPAETEDPNNGYVPLDGVVEKTTILEKRVLPYDPVRESDILWEKKIWRVIDIREKQNLPFAYPVLPFITILMEAARKEEIAVYSTENDRFTQRLTKDEVNQIGSSVDTITKFDPETYEEKIEIVRNEMNPEDVKRFRIKEVWFFDIERSELRVRILGIAPLMDVKDDNGNFLYEQPMFWVYYPDSRDLLSKSQAFTGTNDATPMSWEDLLEMRMFSSYIFKESNVYDRRLEGYLSGVDLLMEGEKIKLELFNFEHDLWQY